MFSILRYVHIFKTIIASFLEWELNCSGSSWNDITNAFYQFQRTALKAARTTEAFRRAEKYAVYYRRVRSQEVRLARLAKAEGCVRVEAQPKVAFVMRIKG